MLDRRLFLKLLGGAGVAAPLVVLLPPPPVPPPIHPSWLPVRSTTDNLIEALRYTYATPDRVLYLYENEQKKQIQILHNR